MPHWGPRYRYAASLALLVSLATPIATGGSLPRVTQQPQSATEEQIEQLIQAGDTAYKARDFQRAERSYSEAIKRTEAEFGKQDPRLIKALIKLSSVHFPREFPAPFIFAQGGLVDTASYRFAHFTLFAPVARGSGSPPMTQLFRQTFLPAGDLLRRALKICQQTSRAQSMEAVEVYEALGAHYLAINEWPKGEASFESMLSIREQLMGPESVELVRDLNTLAFVKRTLAKPAEALSLAQRAIRLLEFSQSDNERLKTTSFFLLAVSHADMKQYSEAEALIRQRISLHSADTANSAGLVYFLLNEHSLILRKLGRKDEAKRQEKAAAAIRETASQNVRR